jgi:hypothetical protein
LLSEIVFELTRQGCVLHDKAEHSPPQLSSTSLFACAPSVKDQLLQLPPMADQDLPPEGVQTGLPQDPTEFDADPRVSWSRLDNKFILETEEGNEFEWDTALKRWIPVVGYKSQT